MKMLRFCSFVLMMAISLSSWSGNVIDQQTGASVLKLSNTGGAQTFEPSASNISGAGLFCEEVFLCFVDIAVWSNLPNLGGTMLARATLGPGVVGWNDAFWAPVSVAVDASYFLIFGGGISGNDGTGAL